MTYTFWRQALERAVKTFAQTLLAMWGTQVFDVFHVGWKVALGVAVGAAVLSVLASFASIPFGDKGDPSMVRTE